MRIRKAAIACAVMLIPGTLAADDHRADRFGGFSYGQGSSLFGVHYTDAVTVPGLGDDLSVVYADLAAQFGSQDGSDVARFSYMTGLRWTFAEEVAARNDPHPKFLPFVHGLVGGVYNNHVRDGGNDLALAVGGGFDYVLNRDRSQEHGEVALRAQVDYFVKGGKDFPRVSFGVVIRSK